MQQLKGWRVARAKRAGCLLVFAVVKSFASFTPSRGLLCDLVSCASQTHRQELQRPHVIPLGLEKFAEDAHAQPELLLHVLPALGSVLAPALLRHFFFFTQSSLSLYVVVSQ